jgi:threonine/homoserine/homoserine lactone efflux protein
VHSAQGYKVKPMNWQEFTALLVLATAMSFTPGPNTALSTALAANYGLRRALPFLYSVSAGWGILLTPRALGLGALVLTLPLPGGVLKLVGIAYLLWLAFRLAARQQVGEADASRLNMSFWQCAALQFVNVKACMLALSIVSGLIAGRPDAGQRFAVVRPLMPAYAFGSNLAYALVGSLLRHWLAGPDGSGARLLAFNGLMALMLASAAVWILLR